MPLSAACHLDMNERRAFPLLIFLLIGDLIFIAVHIIQHTLVQNSQLWYDRLTAVTHTYLLIKLFLVVILVAVFFRITKCAGYISWLLVFVFFFIDDALHLHQSIARMIIDWLISYSPQIASLPERFIELASLGITGVFLSIIVAYAYFRSSSTFRKITKYLLVFILALFFFGILVDLVSPLKPGAAVLRVLDILEDGGELVVYSFILWYLFLLLMHNGQPGHISPTLHLKRDACEPS